MKTAAILLMGGVGQRCHPEIPKQYLLVQEKPLYKYSLETILESALFDQVVVVANQKLDEPGITLAPGGATRQASAFSGLQACNDDITHVLIQDAARPFSTTEILQRNVKALELYDAVNTGIPAFDAMNKVRDGEVLSITKRGEYYVGQTPQSFRKSLILEAHKTTKQENAFDDCSLILELGESVHMVQGEESNIKITTPFDVDFAKYVLYSKKN